MIIRMCIIESGAVVSCACTIYFVGGWRILHRCLKILWKTFIIGLDCCSLHLFVKLCLQDNRVKHSTSFKLLTHDKKRKKSSLKFKMPKCTNLSFNSTARSVQNLLGYVTRPEQVWDSILLMIPECTNWGIAHLTQTLISFFVVGTIRCSSRSWNPLSCVSMVVCLHFKNIVFHCNCTPDFPFHFSTAAGMTSDLTSVDCAGLFPFCIMAHTLASFIP